MTKASIEREDVQDEAFGPDPREKRRSERAPLVVRVDYTTVDTFFSEFTANINEGGLFIDTDSPPPLGTAVILKFKLPGEDDPIKVEGRVVWASPDGSADAPGFGIEFENLDREARARIDQVVRNLRRRESDAELRRRRGDARS